MSSDPKEEPEYPPAFPALDKARQELETFLFHIADSNDDRASLPYFSNLMDTAGILLGRIQVLQTTEAAAEAHWENFVGGKQAQGEGLLDEARDKVREEFMAIVRGNIGRLGGTVIDAAESVKAQINQGTPAIGVDLAKKTRGVGLVDAVIARNAESDSQSTAAGMAPRCRGGQ